ncbi:hypothetical protein [uncultured Desulfovibrio sp.]|uniref:hypothetical protein n=1 Tax=uncultured Desulfovibrio sp. TaxID=167968 RepID=UPI0026DCB517|nr:hypothetical protein [uncultured Desulfovibrio sp.]
MAAMVDMDSFAPWSILEHLNVGMLYYETVSARYLRCRFSRQRAYELYGEDSRAERRSKRIVSFEILQISKLTHGTALEQFHLEIAPKSSATLFPASGA